MIGDNILNDIKTMLGIEPTETHFDPQILGHINSVVMVLNQIGVGPENTMVRSETLWVDLIGYREDLQAVRSYIFLKVKLLFDPPATGFVLTSVENQTKELEWRLNVQAEGGAIPNASQE